jgi:Glycosyltransferase sugar-binding region containing DXD motif
MAEVGFNHGLDIVPNIVHQIYDYQAPNFFMYLSLLCVQKFVRPQRHVLWVNDEGRYRRGHWDQWQHDAIKNKPQSWEANLVTMINSKVIEAQLITFPAHPPGNESIFATQKAHRSDFVRMEKLDKIGGIYLDTDAYVIDSLREFRRFNFTLGFDNIVNSDENAPKKLNNGVLVSSPASQFLRIWMSQYNNFDPNSWDTHSSVLPFKLAAKYPDLVHMEMSRISPLSYGFQSSLSAAALTCGILVRRAPVPSAGTRSSSTSTSGPAVVADASASAGAGSDLGGNSTDGHDHGNRNSSSSSSRSHKEHRGTGTGSGSGSGSDHMDHVGTSWLREVSDMGFYAIWHPRWSKETKAWTFEGTQPDEYLFQALTRKLVVHLTMSAVRYDMI